ncbi:hypothetical protein NMH_0616 [Neisseria meningitidis H44/76]|uniref:Uncharacterized protein n=1 Tax=Neisseria meningitidis serogroup B / serotype 15 (strain H44/76) TaxID=909420 RepID=E6MX13_NEIMH|nr:hypothetical protein NMH_0616 [Neisseria meningitidis H44/76]
MPSERLFQTAFCCRQDKCFQEQAAAYHNVPHLCVRPFRNQDIVD